MKKLLLTGLALATLISCQKDYYLDDLNSAKETIKRLTSDKSDLSKQIQVLNSELSNVNNLYRNALNENSSLSSQLEDLRQELAKTISDLNNANDNIDNYIEIISGLRIDIANLEIALTKEEGNVESLQSALFSLQTMYDNVIGDNEELQKLIEELKDEIAILEGPKNAVYKTFRYEWSYTPEVYPGNVKNGPNFGDDGAIDATDTLNVKFLHYAYVAHDANGDSYKDYLFFRDYNFHDSTHISVVGHNHYKVTAFRTYSKLTDSDGVVHENVLRTDVYDVTLSDYNQVKNELGVQTREEIQEEFRSLGTGFYSDPIYSTLDQDNIYDYWRVFKADAKRHGLDLSHIKLGENLHIEYYDGSSSTICATGGGNCAETNMRVKYYPSCWGNWLHSPFYSERLAVMYHEFGHAVMHYPHPKFDNGLSWPKNVDDGFDEGPDIMGYLTSRGSYNEAGSIKKNPETGKYDLDGNPRTWDEMVDRFFAGTDHTNWCSSKRGDAYKIWED